jgi:hypothetical protein
MADLIIPDEDELVVQESETTLEIGFPFLRLKKTVKKKAKKITVLGRFLNRQSDNTFRFVSPSLNPDEHVLQSLQSRVSDL